jgi:DNA-binding transcriptional LysR family regulator
LKLELRHLEAIAAICTHGSLGAAARALGVAQPSLSQTVARLEEQLGAKLFDRRDGGPLRPTAAAQLIASRGGSILRDVQMLSADLQAATRLAPSVIRIGVGPVTRLKPLPRLLGSLPTEFPETDFVTLVKAGADLVPALLSDECDVIFCSSDRAQAHPDLVRLRIFDDRQVAVVRAGHPASTQDALDVPELLKYRLAGPGLTPLFKSWLASADAERLPPLRVFESLDYELVKQQVRISDAVGIGPRFVFAPEIDEGIFHELEIGWSAPYECWMLTRRDRWRPALLDRIANLARAAADTRSAAQQPIAAGEVSAGAS